MGRKKSRKLEVYHKILVIGVIIFLFVLADPLALRTCILSRNHMYLSNLVGNSMYPFISDGEIGVVLLKTAPNYDLEIGDIVVYYSDEHDCYIGHRVLLIDDDFVYAKGDNNQIIDDPIAQRYVIGELVDHIPEYNFVKKWFVEMILNPENIPDNS